MYQNYPLAYKKKIIKVSNQYDLCMNYIQVCIHVNNLLYQWKF